MESLLSYFIVGWGQGRFEGISQEGMIKASGAAFHHDYEPMEAIIAKSIKKKFYF